MIEESITIKYDEASARETWEPTNHFRRYCKLSGNSNGDVLELKQLWVSNLLNTEWRPIEIVEE